MANPVGRPPKYKTNEELQAKIQEYIQDCPDTQTIFFKLKDEVIEKEAPCPTITGLVLYLGFCDRASFYDMEKIEKFAHTIKHARTWIESTYEQLLKQGNASGAIFALKNFGWTDLQKIEHSGGVNVTSRTTSMSDEELEQFVKDAGKTK